MNSVGLVIANFFIILVRGYQRFISPLFGKKCRFYPTCSEYSVNAIRKYGAFKGLFLTIGRLMRCHPFHPGGYDPVK